MNREIKEWSKEGQPSVKHTRRLHMDWPWFGRHNKDLSEDTVLRSVSSPQVGIILADGNLT